MFNDVLIVAAGRTAVGAFGGALAGIPASELGARVIKALLARCNLQAGQID
ncbi:MAG: acetyl-CoA C-acyltransferase, partial [Hydrogenophilales bacterium CG_4_9_14_3_um_filter_63_34]